MTPKDEHKKGHELDTDVLTVESKIPEPPKFAVILHNDDYTSMEFVVDVLTVDFSKPYQEAMDLMLKVHEEGSAVAGIYSYEIAEAKVEKVTGKARSQGYPLRLSLKSLQD